MKTHWKLPLTIGLVLLLAGSFALAQDNAQAPPRESDRDMGGPFGFLEPEAMEAVRDIIKEHLKDIYPAMQLLKAREAELNILIFDENPDEAAIEAKIAEVTQIQAQLFARKVALRRQLYGVTGMPIPDFGGGDFLRPFFRGAGGRGGDFGPGHGGHPHGPGMSGLDQTDAPQEFAEMAPDMY